MRLNKVQREILSTAIESERRSGHRKPITVAPESWLPRIDEFSKSYARYCKSMEKLIKAGLIERCEKTLSYAYVKDLSAAQRALED